MKIRNEMLAAAVVGLGMSGAVHASTVTFSAPIAIDATTAADVSGTTSVYLIQNIGVQGGQVTSSAGVTTTLNAGGGPTNQAAFGGDTGKAGLNAALQGFAYDTNPVSATLSGLTVGHQYSVALFGLDDRGCCGSRTIYFTAGTGSDGTQDPATHFAESSNQYVVATFTATGASEQFNSVGFDQFQSNFNVIIARDLSAGDVVVAAADFGGGNQFVPEPASLSLLGLGAVSLLARRRRA